MQPARPEASRHFEEDDAAASAPQVWHLTTLHIAAAQKMERATVA